MREFYKGNSSQEGESVILLVVETQQAFSKARMCIFSPITKEPNRFFSRNLDNLTI